MVTFFTFLALYLIYSEVFFIAERIEEDPTVFQYYDPQEIEELDQELQKIIFEFDDKKWTKEDILGRLQEKKSVSNQAPCLKKPTDNN